MHVLGSRHLRNLGEVESVLFYVPRAFYSVGIGRNTIIVPVPVFHNHRELDCSKLATFGGLAIDFKGLSSPRLMDASHFSALMFDAG